MKILMIVLALFGAIGAGAWFMLHRAPTEAMFHIFAVANDVDVQACAAAHGYAAKLALLSADGQLASDWKAACLVEIK